MALLYIDGFDWASTSTDLGRRWTVSGGGTGTSGTTRHSSGRSFSASTNSNISKSITGSGATWIIGFALYISNIRASPILEILDSGTVQIAIVPNDLTGQLRVNRGTGTTLGTSSIGLSLNTWYYIELKVTIGNSGSFDLRIDGVSVASGTGVDTQASAAAAGDTLWLGNSNIAGGSYLFDDVYVCNNSGSNNADFLGELRVETLRPTANGTTNNFAASTGSNYQCVDDTSPNDDTDYVSSSTAADIDLYTMSDISGSPAAVYGIQSSYVARKDDVGIRTSRAVLRISGVNYDGGTTHGLNSSYAGFVQIWDVSPATSAAWSVSTVNAIEAGIKLVS